MATKPNGKVQATKAHKEADKAIVAHANRSGQIEYLALESYDPPKVDVLKQRSGVALFGADNMYPRHTIDQFEQSPTHGAICRYTATLIAGLGFTFDGADEAWVKALGEGRSIDRHGKSWALDLKLHNGYAIQVTWSRDGSKPVRFSYVDFSFVRKDIDDQGNLMGYLLCSNWEKGTRKGGKGVKEMPAFNPDKVKSVKKDDKGNPILDDKGNTIPLMDGILPVIAEPNQLYYFEGTSPGKLHYPKPMHIAADTVIQIDIEFARFHVNNLLNGLLPSLFLEFFGPEPEEAEKDDQEQALKATMKGAKGKKAMVFWNPNGSESAMKVHTLDVKNNESRYLEIAKHIITQIVSGHMLQSPSQAGISGGATLNSTGGEIEAAFKLYSETVVVDLQDQLIEGIQHVLDRSGMQNVTVGIINRDPFGTTATTSIQESNPATTDNATVETTQPTA